jgi:hypothetical protein
MSWTPQDLDGTPLTEDASAESETYQKTLDIYALAELERGERVAVEPIPQDTLEVFEQTLDIIKEEGGQPEGAELDPERLARRLAEAPGDSDLRKVFLFAEVLGSYDAVNDLTRKDSPYYRLSLKYGQTVLHHPLEEKECRYLEEYHDALKKAIANARDYYRNTGLRGLTVEEMQELYTLVMSAREKAKEITEILGRHLILQIEQAVARLNTIREQSVHVDRTVDGIFLVDDEVMFIGSGELRELIDTVFKGVGNPYLAGNIDGVLLLAARNLLIDVVSFYSYYGKHQIYQLFAQDRTIDRHRVTMRIRNEVRKILNACKQDNKLVLTRIMQKEEEKLDLSIEAIQREAEEVAVEAVVKIRPSSTPTPLREKKGWFRRLLAWLGS